MFHKYLNNTKLFCFSIDDTCSRKQVHSEISGIFPLLARFSFFFFFALSPVEISYLKIVGKRMLITFISKNGIMLSSSNTKRWQLTEFFELKLNFLIKIFNLGEII